MSAAESPVNQREDRVRAEGAGSRGERPAGGQPRGRQGTGDTGDEPWTVLRMIRFSAGYLEEKGVESARLDAEHLLAHALETNRLQLYLEYDRPLIADELDRYRPLLRRRAAREPLQYILGRTAFRELELRTDPRALIPRPETEVLVGAVLEWAGRQSREELVAVDVGTGTGCIALSLAVEGPFREVWAVDASARALELARVNVEAVSPPVPVRLIHGEGLRELPETVTPDVVVSNPPYVREDEAHALAPEIRDHEPTAALYAGADGLSVIRALVSEAAERLAPGGLLALEMGAEQGDAVTAIVQDAGAFEDVGVRPDLAGRPRIVTAVRRSGGAAQ